MTGGVAPGWYPDYEAPPGHQRYWNGEEWTERRSDAPVATPGRPVRGPKPSRPPKPERAPRSTTSSASIAGWVWAAVVALVIVSAVVLVVGDDDSAQSGPGASPPPASTPGPPASEGSGPGQDRAQRTWEVDSVVDGNTLRLTNGAEVRLIGIVDGCAGYGLVKLVVGQRVTLTRRGLDKDSDGHLLRYVERDGVDVGLRLIQRGWATASDDANPRGAIYRRVDERSPDRCG